VIRVHDGDPPAELLLREGTEGHDAMELFVCGNATSRTARLIARLDNLGKGASGAAIQNLNIMCGLNETTGLRL
jgi:N-acetyl-gamma-glutamyl-phosphate reductase